MTLLQGSRRLLIVVLHHLVISQDINKQEEVVERRSPSCCDLQSAILFSVQPAFSGVAAKVHTKTLTLLNVPSNVLSIDLFSNSTLRLSMVEHKDES